VRKRSERRGNKRREVEGNRKKKKKVLKTRSQLIIDVLKRW